MEFYDNHGVKEMFGIVKNVTDKTDWNYEDIPFGSEPFRVYGIRGTYDTYRAASDDLAILLRQYPKYEFGIVKLNYIPEKKYKVQCTVYITSFSETQAVKKAKELPLNSWYEIIASEYKDERPV